MHYILYQLIIMIFDDTKLPDFLSIFLLGGPSFITSKITTRSGYDVLKLEHEHARVEYRIDNCTITIQQFAELNAFFRSRRGEVRAFKMRDYADYRVNNEELVPINKKRNKFLLTKTYIDDISPYKRVIHLPTINSMTLSTTQGQSRQVVMLDSPFIIIDQDIAEGEKLIASFEFDVMVKFNNSTLKYKYNDDSTVNVYDISLSEYLPIVKRPV